MEEEDHTRNTIENITPQPCPAKSNVETHKREDEGGSIHFHHSDSSMCLPVNIVLGEGGSGLQGV